ncbi:hypothetical protein [Oceanobacillus sp. J11TS1]|uniref:hypothetical protein n=1 Tax=Oceanobacillus sp. J11TS1 TaxID=2807191 RepID=UPI001B0C2493|nr:hypothetical protein [Oceanobacillus sp. J11TS1]GIO22184.1 hypothetical protein J11TS1_07650 [Oceanobacillus sp. J11TS1]
MIKKRTGKINEIIYDNTVYHNGEYRIYPSVPQLFRVLDKVKKARETTDSLTMIPFYRNAKRNGQIEFESMVFYLECKENVSDNDLNAFLNQCCEEGQEISDDIRKRFYLCSNNDVDTFIRAINTYIDYLDTLVPQMIKTLKSEYHFGESELMFGFICFSIDSK